MDDDEVTLWLERLATGDEVAAQQIWHRYIQQMLSFRASDLPPRTAGLPMKRIWR